MHGARILRAFTLIELLVILAIISLLLSMLLPSLRGAREAGRSAVCLSQQRSLVQGQAMYMASNDDYFAGPRTTGYKGLLGQAGDEIYTFDTTQLTPTSTMDWVSPTMGDSLGLSSNRARRTAQLFNHFACPTARNFNVRAWDEWGMLDEPQFEEIVRQEGVRQISYLSPAPFHYWPGSISQAATNALNQQMGGQAPILQRTPVDVPSGYRPRQDRIGLQPSGKALVSDGTRYFAQALGGGVLDFDIDATPEWFGCFLDSGPIFHGSGAFGRGFNAEAAPGRHLLSFRHPGLSFNVGYFDGHVAAMKAADAWADATPWYPGGSKYGNIQATPESAAFYARDGVSNIIP